MFGAKNGKEVNFVIGEILIFDKFGDKKAKMTDFKDGMLSFISGSYL